MFYQFRHSNSNEFNFNFIVPILSVQLIPQFAESAVEETPCLRECRGNRR
jgi:hypothetical protein